MEERPLPGIFVKKKKILKPNATGDLRDYLAQSIYSAKGKTKSNIIKLIFPILENELVMKSELGPRPPNSVPDMFFSLLYSLQSLGGGNRNHDLR